ncbi:MAG: prepilin-type N-terminal cleavage/methylation domain-containing protein [Myxococcota bacterium]
MSHASSGFRVSAENVRRTQGCTLLEVLIAVVVFGTVMTALLVLATDSIRNLGRARLEAEAGRLAEAWLRERLADDESEELAELGRSEGEFDAHQDLFRWELSVEAWGIPLAPELAEFAGLSRLFQDETTLDLSEPSLRRITLRVLDAQSGEDVIDPFIVFTLAPLDDDALHELAPAAGADSDEDDG